VVGQRDRRLLVGDARVDQVVDAVRAVEQRVLALAVQILRLWRDRCHGSDHANRIGRLGSPDGPGPSALPQSPTLGRRDIIPRP